LNFNFNNPSSRVSITTYHLHSSTAVVIVAVVVGVVFRVVVVGAVTNVQASLLFPLLFRSVRLPTPGRCLRNNAPPPPSSSVVVSPGAISHGHRH
jgi:hypothetical protein